MNILNSVSALIENPRDTEKTYRIATYASGFKVVSAAGFTSGVVLSALGILAMVAIEKFPILKTSFLLSGLSVTIISSEAFAVSCNVESLMIDHMNDLKAVIAPDKFVKKSFKNTWLIAFLFKNWILRKMKKS